MVSADIPRLSDQAVEQLLELYDRLDASLLRYLREATPWADPRQEDLVAQLHEYASDQERGLQVIADLVFRFHLLPESNGWPNEFATLHYLSLQYVIDRLVADQRTIVGIAEELLAVWPEDKARASIESVRSGEAERLNGLLHMQREFAKPAT